jgi:hypothetical protein
MGILTPTKGIRHIHRNLKFGYFSQHHVDQLDMNASSVELLQSSYPGTVCPEVYIIDGKNLPSVSENVVGSRKTVLKIQDTVCKCGRSYINIVTI